MTSKYKEDGRVFEITHLDVQESYLSPQYVVVQQDPIVLQPNGLLALFKLQPISCGPSFIVRWDGGSRDEGKTEKQDLDTDIKGVSNAERRRFKRGQRGYAGHQSTPVPGATGRAYTVSISTPTRRSLRLLCPSACFGKSSLPRVAAGLLRQSVRRLTHVEELNKKYFPVAPQSGMASLSGVTQEGIQ